MNTDRETATDAAEQRVRAALAELAGYTERPRPLRLDTGRVGAAFDIGGGVRTGDRSRTDAVRRTASADRSVPGGGAVSVIDVVDEPDRLRRPLAVAAALLLLVVGVIGIAWRQRTQSGAQLATAPPTAVTAPVDPSISSEVGAASSSMAGGSMAGGAVVSTSVPSAAPAPDATTAGGDAPSASSASASVPNPNGDASPESGAVPTRTITAGDTGDDVLALQQRLSALGFFVGSADGVYGVETTNGVWAFQTLVLGTPLSAVTDEVTPELWSAIHAPVTITPRRPNAATTRHIEIYLSEQVLVVFDGATPLLITHVSTGALDDAGNPQEYCERIEPPVDRSGAPVGTQAPGEVCGTAKTPGGVFKIDRIAEGLNEDLLGVKFDPVYFNYELAIHGALDVPLQPASHGSVRVDRAAILSIHSLIAVGDEVAVWNGQQEPDQVSEADSKPAFGRFTPDNPNDLEGPPSESVG